MGLLHWLFLAILLLLGHAESKPVSHEVQNNNDNSNKDQTLQSRTHPSVHKVDSETTEGDDGDSSLSKEILLTNRDQDLEEDPIYDETQDEEISADKRGGGGSLHRTHSRRNHTVSQRQKRSDKSSEENKLELLSADHVAHKRSAEHDGHKEKRSTGQGIEEEDSDGSFDGLEYVGEFDDKEKDREKRNHQHREPEETVEMEEMPPFLSDMSQHVQSVALRVKRVNKAGSSHRNLRINKNKGNSKAGQTEEQPPPVIIDPM